MRGTQLLRAGALAALALVLVPAVADASVQTATCVGTTTLDPPTNYSDTSAPGVTIERWDFTGVQDLCLADGTVVDAAMKGSLILVTRDDGTGWALVRYTLEVPNGTLRGIVRAHFSPTSFDATVRVYGGTGLLAGMSGYGTTQPTGPNTFLDRIVYKYI